MKLYIDRITTDSFEIEVSEEDLRAAATKHHIENDAIDIGDLVWGLEKSYRGQLVLSGLIGDSKPIDQGEKVTMVSVDSGE